MTETFGADVQHPWATRWRIPRVTNPYPGWRFEVAVCVPDPADTMNLFGVEEPSEAEAAIIATYIDFRRSYYRERWQQKMLARPFDIDSSTNTVVLARTERGWKYRRASFEHGLWPMFRDEREALFPATSAGLVALLDRICMDSRNWVQWKADRADMFAAAEVKS